MSVDWNTAAADEPRVMQSVPAARHTPIQWRRAFRALRNLIADAERTDQVFEIISACSGPSGERMYRAFVRDPVGQRLLLSCPSLQDTLKDRGLLAALPADSFGAAYHAFMTSGSLDAEGLAMASEEAAEAGPDEEQLDPERQWFYDRVRDMHDLWHVLTGYGRDEAGEIANLAFSYAQLRNRGILLIVFAGAMLGPKGGAFSWQRYLWSAYRRGRAASNLSLAPYEELLSRPLEEVRFELGILPASVVHPDGIVVASRDGELGVADAPTGPAAPAA